MEISRIFDLTERYRVLYPNKEIALGGKNEGKWYHFSTSQYLELIDCFSAGLLSLGLQPGTKIASVFLNNRPEWNIFDIGMMQAGMIHVPVYPTISDQEHRYILEHSDAEVLIVSDKSTLKKLSPIASEIPKIKLIVSLNEIEGVKNWQEIISLGRENIESKKAEIQQIRNSIKPDDLATIIYTSGTTGNPKGVMLSHKNLVSNFIPSSELLPIDNNHKVLSFLPLCHVYERMMNYAFQYRGIAVYYAENLGTIADDLKAVKPHGFNTVPRLLERFYDRIIAKGKDLKGYKRFMFFWAVRLGLKYKINKGNGWFYEFKLKIARKLIFSKWHQAMGGNLKVVVSGGAALQPRLERIFWAAGIPVLEGYGLTETSPVIAVNNFKPGNLKFGTVGPALQNVEIKIDEDGEILTRGPHIMLGYYKDSVATTEVIDSEGWFHTGDIGRIEDDIFLKITDRKKSIFKNSAGKYIAPQIIENKLKESDIIEQAMVVGESEKFVSALISPNFNYLHFFAGKHKIHFRDNQELIKDPVILKKYQEEIAKINKGLGQVEQIKRFRLVCEEWTPVTGELSPTLKLKRNILYKKYDHILREIYSYGGNEENRAKKE
ncbi:MAG: long-chain fatty acid--CoA ligase [Bacteroidales bacterium]|nr:long-chain fatty acid--CoA ligase [Bacteroidales bacterium]